MKKCLMALAVLGCAGGAGAQVAGTGAGEVTSSSVTLFGVVDLAVAYGHGSENNLSRLVSGANTVSRLGFRGVEDLGGGLGAGFWLESGLNVDDGTGSGSNTNNQPSGATSSGALTFGRRATASLMGTWGEIRLGRDYVATFRNRDQTDPFTTNGVGASLPYAISIIGVTETRASNMIGYFLPAAALGGFFGEAQYYMGENTSGSDGNGWQARLGYANKVWGVAGAYGLTKYAQTATTGDNKAWNIGGHWNFGWANLMAGWFEDEVERTSTLKGTGYILGAVIPIRVDQLKISYSSYKTDDVGDPRTQKLAVGYVYNLSKRTAAYGTYAHVQNHGSAAVGLNGSLTGPGKNSDGFDLGLKHSF
ncbi:porin [Ramlibacter ginsenosidimutans]|uniref:Porin n=2 Tax=Ramlibacter ginsenosidimutans TaxID=502333 RepID=A0A934TRX9_9BURK|nr:porin [Ramlibacter ginsenosidimutans]MBK6005881.1 porin [Ramlibacter ginsenosidimutans]